MKYRMSQRRRDGLPSNPCVAVCGSGAQRAAGLGEARARYAKPRGFLFLWSIHQIHAEHNKVVGGGAATTRYAIKGHHSSLTCRWNGVIPRPAKAHKQEEGLRAKQMEAEPEVEEDEAVPH